MSKNKVAVYIRYNKPIEDIQEEAFINYAKNNNLDLYKVYVDICSGVMKNPPELTKMLNDSDNFDTLLVHSLDRISRNATKFYEVKKKLYNSNVNIFSLKEGLII